MDSDDVDVGINDAGLGVTVGDWQIGGTWSGSTDDRYDTPENRRRAEQRDEDAREAKRRGETTPNPIHDLLHPPTPPDPSQDPVFRSIQDANRRNEPDMPIVIHDPLTGNPVVLHSTDSAQAPDASDSMQAPSDSTEDSTPASEPGDYPEPSDDSAWA